MASSTQTSLPAKHLAYEYIRREILWDDSNDARLLAEETVGNLLGLSRTPVREAFLRLEAEGLLTLVPRKGAMIVPITEREMREVMEVRSVVETWSVGTVLGVASSQLQLAADMRAHHAALVDLGRDPDLWTFIEADRRFHRHLVAAAGNRVMLDLYERLRDQQLRLGVRAVSGDPKRLAAVNAEHERIVAALESGDVDLAITAIDRHLEATGSVLRRRLGVT